jgi:hypothetical protein
MAREPHWLGQPSISAIFSYHQSAAVTAVRQGVNDLQNIFTHLVPVHFRQLNYNSVIYLSVVAAY